MGAASGSRTERAGEGICGGAVANARGRGGDTKAGKEQIGSWISRKYIGEAGLSRLSEKFCGRAAQNSVVCSPSSRGSTGVCPSRRCIPRAEPGACPAQ